ncbi:glutathione S-transferase T3-like [Eutrema salsugineum]|uniref:glutathione S-transferase T3-like n=1 Tax=Eutrema salsugineum TaxID=72664 RepID=UPI000CED02C6|nr:glutathione S-transferase T3-like [Eutrema salsugineum]
MDSPIPFSNSHGFVNLLTSQQQENPNPFTYPHVIDLGSSETFPRFSSQRSDDPTTPGESSKQLRRQWTPKEDVVLISSWLNTSKDPVVSNEQKFGAFWKRIETYFNGTLKLSGENARSASQCKQRWGRLNDQVCKYVGCFEAAKTQQTSGQNENDLMKAAGEIFYNDYGVKFTLDHAWRELRHDQKWCATTANKEGDKGKRRKLEASTCQSSSFNDDGVNDDVSQPRPIGVKAAKKAAASKNKGVHNTTEQAAECVQSVWKIKQKDLEMRDKLTNKKLLDKLLARSESLSDREVALKNQLINELLQ